MASSDLGGLGAKDGSPVEYNWVLPSVAPLFLPWLALLVLLALKPNRHAAAWLIWLPLGCVMAFTLMPPMILPAGANFLLDVVGALALGVAAVWLLSKYLRQSHWLMTFFCVLFALAGFSALAFMSKEGWNLLSADAIPIGIVLAVGVLATSVSLSLASLICHGRYRPIGLYLWLPVSLVAIWLLVAAPIFLFAQIMEGWRLPWGEFFIPVLTVGLVNFAILLPFLILSSASPFYRERFKALLHVKPETPPPLSAPSTGANLNA